MVDVVEGGGAVVVEVVVFVVVAAVVVVDIGVDVLVVVVLLQDTKTRDVTIRQVSAIQIIPFFINTSFFILKPLIPAIFVKEKSMLTCLCVLACTCSPYRFTPGYFILFRMNFSACLEVKGFYHRFFGFVNNILAKSITSYINFIFS